LGNLFGTHLLVAAAELSLGSMMDLSKLTNHFPAGFPSLFILQTLLLPVKMCAHQPHLPDFSSDTELEYNTALLQN
jgi:hypothetical protein